MKYIIALDGKAEIVDSIPEGYTGLLIEITNFSDGMWIGTAETSSGSKSICADEITVSYV